MAPSPGRLCTLEGFGAITGEPPYTLEGFAVTAGEPIANAESSPRIQPGAQLCDLLCANVSTCVCTYISTTGSSKSSIVEPGPGGVART
jgi:hypothetical protein